MTAKQMSLELMLINLVKSQTGAKGGEGRFIRSSTQIKDVQNPDSSSDVLLKFT